MESRGMQNEEILSELKASGLKIYKQKLSQTFSNPFFCGKQKDEILASFSNCSSSSSNLEKFVETIVTFSSKLAVGCASSLVRVKENLQKSVFPTGVSYDVKNEAFSNRRSK